MLRNKKPRRVGGAAVAPITGRPSPSALPGEPAVSFKRPRRGKRRQCRQAGAASGRRWLTVNNAIIMPAGWVGIRRQGEPDGGLSAGANAGTFPLLAEGKGQPAPGARRRESNATTSSHLVSSAPCAGGRESKCDDVVAFGDGRPPARAGASNGGRDPYKPAGSAPCARGRERAGATCAADGCVGSLRARARDHWDVMPCCQIGRLPARAGASQEGRPGHSRRPGRHREDRAGVGGGAPGRGSHRPGGV